MLIRTCKNCCHYPDCPEWNNNDICLEHLIDEESSKSEEDIVLPNINNR